MLDIGNENGHLAGKLQLINFEKALFACKWITIPHTCKIEFDIRHFTRNL